MNLGWIGLGKMGKPMSKQLLKAGYPVSVYNRSKEKEHILEKEGAITAGSPKELLEKCDVVFMMVSDDAAVKDIFTAENGLLAARTAHKIVVNMSTVSADISKEMAARLKEKDNQYLDAPVSGSVKQAEEASLVIIAGGETAVFEKVKPLLEIIGKKAIHLGETGSGNLTKLAVNTFLGIITQGLAEVIKFSSTKNIRTEDFLDIINNSALGSPFIEIKGNAVLEENFNAAFTLNHLTKDLRLAQEAGYNGPLGNETYSTFKEAQSELGEEDVIAIIKKL